MYSNAHIFKYILAYTIMSMQSCTIVQIHWLLLQEVYYVSSLALQNNKMSDLLPLVKKMIYIDTNTMM